MRYLCAVALFSFCMLAHGSAAAQTGGGAKAQQGQAGSGDESGGLASLEAADAALESSARQLLPMNKDQIRQFKRRLSETQEAIHAREPAQLDTQSKILRLEPGSATSTIQIAPGYVSSVVFLDQTGQPWPVTSVALGDSTAFDVQHPKIKEKNLLTVAAKGRNRDSNLSITLEGHSTPIILRVSTNAEQASALMAFRADQMGPNARPQPIGPPAQKTIGSTMMAFLDGVPPADATRLDTQGVQGRDIQVWRYDGKLYLRSHQSAVWPAWHAVAKGSGGVRVYEMPNETHLMISENGSVNTVSLSQAAQY